MAHIHLAGKQTNPKTGDIISYTYTIDKHPKTRLVVQQSRDGYWYIYKLTGDRVVMADEEVYKSMKDAIAACVKYASFMEPKGSK